ncbi:MAG: rhomboid family intramembrane serine protease [Verrucomicrobiales bacterium]|nr:rhomboid family intramembrane serine protease [Verrucomicrobiales bacterium]
MSIYSRDYMRDSSSGSGPRSWSMVTWLIGINVVMLILTMVVAPLSGFLALSWESLTGLQIWTLITYQFVHADPFHLLFNMIGLFFLGRMLQQALGGRHILKIYLYGGIFGGLLQVGLSQIIGESSFVIGASASVLAIIVALATFAPYQVIQLLLFFVIPVSLKLKHLAYILVGIDLLTLLYQLTQPGQSNTAVMAHLGGMLFGFLYIRYWLPRQNIQVKKPSLKERFGVRILKDDEPAKEKPTKTSSPRKKPFLGSEIDAILDKINEEGFQSLTAEEKKMLEKSSKKLSKKIDGKQ